MILGGPNFKTLVKAFGQLTGAGWIDPTRVQLKLARSLGRKLRFQFFRSSICLSPLEETKVAIDSL